MKKKYAESSPAGKSGHTDIASLIDQLSAAEEALRKATNDQVDAIMLSDGQPYMLSTARKALEESQKALQASEKRFRSLIENSSDVISLIDQNGNITYSSPSLTKILGYKPEERTGQNIFENIHPDDKHRMKKVFHKLLQKPGLSVNEAVRYRHKNGEWRWMEGYAKNLLEEPSVQSIVLNFRDITQNKLAIDALFESEEKYRTLIETANTGYLIVDDEGVVIVANREYARLSGHDEPTDIIGRNVTEWTAEHDIERNAAEIRKCMERGYVRDLEVDYVDRHGKITTVEINANIIQPQTKPRILSICRDVTQRKLAEISLQRSEQRFSYFMKNLPGVAFMKDKSGHYQFVNSIWKQFFAIDPGDVIGKTDDELWPPEIAQQIKEIDRDIIEKGEPVQIVEMIPSTRGKTHWLTSKFPIPDHNGNIEMLGAVAIDITERREAEEKLHSEVNFSNALLNSLPGIVFCFDENLRFLRWNENFERVLDYSHDAVAELSLLDVFEGPDRELISEKISEVFALGMSDAEAEIVTRDSKKIPYYFTGKRVEIDGITCVVGVGIDMTELRLAEQRLALLNFALDRAHEASYLMDEDSRFLDVNQEACRALGYSKEELLNMKVTDIDPDVTMEKWRNYWQKIRKESNTQVEAWHQRKDGRVFPVEITANYFEYDGKGYDLALVRDITERKQAEELLLKNQRNLLKAQKLARLGNWEWYTQENYVTGSEELFRIFALVPEQERCPLHEFLDRIHADDQESVNQTIQEILSGARNGLNMEYRVVHPDGEIRHVIAQGESVFTPQDKLSHLFGVIQDVTEQKQAEAALRESERRFRTMADSAPVLIWMTNREGGCTYFNQGWIDYTGRTFEQEKGKGWLKDIHPDDLQHFLDVFNNALQNRQPYKVEKRLRRADGEYRWFLDTGIPRYTDDGMFAGYIGTCVDITELRDAQSFIRESELRFRNVAKATSDTIWDWDLKTDNVWWNEGMQTIFGYASEEIEPGSESWSGRIHPEDRDRVVNSINTVIMGKKDNWSEEYRFRRKDGFYLHIIDSGFVIRDKNGKGIRMVGGMRDITEKMLAEQALRKSELSLSEAQRIARLGSWELDLTSGHLHWSNEVYRIFNLGKEEFDNTYEGFISHVHPDDREYLEKIQEQALAGKNEYNVEHRIVWPDGSIRWVNETGEAERDGDGRPIRFIGTVLDITVRKNAEIAVQNRDTLLRTVGEMAKVGGWEMDIKSGECVWTEEIAKIIETDAPFGLESGLEYYQGEYRQKIRNALGDAIENGIPYDLKLEMMTAKGNRKWIRSIALPIMDGKTVTGLVGSMQDITEQSALEEQLLQSQKLESIGHLTGGIAHDFNNMLTVIMGNAELLGDRLASDKKLQPLAEMINSAARRGADLTQRLLAFARKQNLEPHSTDVNQLLSDMESLLHRTLGEHIEIRFNLQKNLWLAMIDPGQLENAILNLCINARDAMAKGSMLTLETENKDLVEGYIDKRIEIQPGQYIMIAVTDTGSGISPENLAQIFEPFFTTKEKGKGTGLGMSMVYGFVKQSGGHINIYSELDQGTTIKLYLPRTTEEFMESRTTIEDLTVTGGTETILLVEDDALVRDYAKNQLLSLGYQVITAEDGPHAMAVIRENRDIDLLFTDVIMPAGMSGPDLARAALAELPGLKVLYTSGYTEDAFEHEGRLEPGIQLLSKPYSRVELARMIRHALDNNPDS